MELFKHWNGLDFYLLAAGIFMTWQLGVAIFERTGLKRRLMFWHTRRQYRNYCRFLTRKYGPGLWCGIQAPPEVGRRSSRLASW